MRSRTLTPTLAGLAVMLVAWLSETSAEAYCRQRSCNDDDAAGRVCQRDPQAMCITEGRELGYTSPCLTFAIAHDSGRALGLSDARFEELVTRAFETWLAVDCDRGAGPGFVVQSAGVVQTGGPFYCAEEPANNVSVFTITADWEYLPSQLGFTHTNFLPSSGSIVDADVELNQSRFQGSSPEDAEQLLQDVLVHEVGHFLGLAHSNDAESVMAASYDPEVAALPALTQDDVTAICAVFPPSGTPAQCPAARVHDQGLSEEACELGSTDGATTADTACSARLTPTAAPKLNGWWALGLWLGSLVFRRATAYRAR